ncbi:hypothetical protein PTKIN_Ptkin14bG0101700 [Pterospermum kingtungense]
MKKRVVLVRFNEGFGFNGGGGNGGGDGKFDSNTARLLGNIALALGLSYLSLLAVLVPIVGVGAFLWWAGRDIVHCSCLNCGNDFQIFKSFLNDELHCALTAVNHSQTHEDVSIDKKGEVPSLTTAAIYEFQNLGYFLKDLVLTVAYSVIITGFRKDSSAAVVDVEAEPGNLLIFLTGIYGPKGVDMPDPIQAICTTWGSDPVSYGSYSHVRVQSLGCDYGILEKVWGTGKLHIFSVLHLERNVGAKDPKSSGLLRITFDNRKDDMKKVLERSCEPLSNQPLQLYTTLSREQAHELQLLPGKEERKLEYLINNIGLKLMGANALGNFCNSLVTSISNARRGRGRNRISAPQQSTV